MFSKRGILVTLAAIVAVSLFSIPAVTFANHPCTDTDAQPNIDAAARHGCKPAGAAGSGTLDTIPKLLGQVNAALNTLVPFLVGIAVLVVMWGILKYVLTAAEEEKRSEARRFVFWGVVFIFCMLSVWGFVNVLVNSFSLSKQAPSQRPVLPEIPIPKG